MILTFAAVVFFLGLGLSHAGSIAAAAAGEPSPLARSAAVRFILVAALIAAAAGLGYLWPAAGGWAAGFTLGAAEAWRRMS